jgi:hypothetical protein
MLFIYNIPSGTNRAVGEILRALVNLEAGQEHRGLRTATDSSLDSTHGSRFPTTYELPGKPHTVNYNHEDNWKTSIQPARMRNKTTEAHHVAGTWIGDIRNNNNLRNEIHLQVHAHSTNSQPTHELDKETRPFHD